MVFAEKFSVMSNDKVPTFHDVTERVRQIVEQSGIQTGTVTVYSHHTTCCVITQEVAFDRSMTGMETLQVDFVEMFERIQPTQRREGMYLHPGPKALIRRGARRRRPRLPQHRRAPALARQEGAKSSPSSTARWIWASSGTSTSSTLIRPAPKADGRRRRPRRVNKKWHGPSAVPFSV